MIELDFIDNYRTHSKIDFKTEVIFLALLKSALDDKNIIIKNKGTFYRGFSKDRLSIEFDSVYKEDLVIEVSRDGFYDVLPENYIHNYLNRDVGLDSLDEFKLRKKEEKEARFFFNPLENEFFRFFAETEYNEQKILSKLNSYGISDILRDILSIENKLIPDNYIVKMFFNLLKYNHSGDQNLENICEILSNIIDENVTYCLSSQIIDDRVIEKNEDFVLGVTSTLSVQTGTFLKNVNFEIGPLKNSEIIIDFFDGRKMNLFLEAFFNLFLPVHMTFSYNLNLNLEDKQFAMDEKEFKSRLGISTVI